jgi:hypothetical protein
LLTRVFAQARSNSVSLAVLIIANLIPLFGVLFLRWSVATVLILYWVENGVVGLMTIAKIVFAAGPPTTVATKMFGRAGNVLAALLFTFQYGWFWVIHGIFVVVLTGLVTGPGVGFPNPVQVIAGQPGLVLAALALIFGHGADVILNYFGRGEFRRSTAAALAAEPFPRMIVLHVTIIFGALAIAVVGQPVALVALLVIAKTVLDVSLFLRQRRKTVSEQLARTAST